MASLTSSAVTIPSFTGLKSAGRTPSRVFTTVKMPVSKFTVKASLKEAGLAAAVAFTASAMLAGSALAIDIKLGSDNGELAFVPSTFTVKSGERINFSNNAAYPHNVIFDEDEVPSGVDVEKISMPDEDYLNAPGEVYSVVLTEKGTYSFYCSPHQGAGMAGKVTVT